MKYDVEKWSISKLIELYGKEKLDLSPPYQRNEVWSLKSQKDLIETINSGYPIPNFFVYKSPNGTYEMVDGQQRSRSILSFFKGEIPDNSKRQIDSFPNFKNYTLIVIIISELNGNDHIEEFYALVNRTGLRLNKPELYKAQYYDTRFHKLVQELCDDELFTQLGLFRTTNRMNDSDLVSELLALLYFGISDKKEKIDSLYIKDISENEFQTLKDNFLKIIQIINDWNLHYPFNLTRYKQKNDLYTLFSIIEKTEKRFYEYMYKVLTAFSPVIKPSSDCKTFIDYTTHCITQSNSKKAREERERILTNIIFPNLDTDESKQIFYHFDLNENDLEYVGGRWLYKVESLEEAIQAECE